MATLPATMAMAQDEAPALSATVATPLTVADADDLKPGQFLWQPDVAAVGPVGVVVDLSRQVAYVYRGNALIGITTVSTGRDGHDTPLGTFPILQKQVEHKSNLYNSAAMPFMQRLTWDGVALHAGGVPGFRESHGCVHLPDAFAKLLYGATDVGGIVAITEDGTSMADALPLGRYDPSGEALASADDGSDTPVAIASNAAP